MNIKKITAMLLCAVLMAFYVPLSACKTDGNTSSGVLLLSASSTELTVGGAGSVSLNTVASDSIKDRTVTYTVIEGPATITGNEVRSTSTSQVGDKVKIKATAGDVTSNTIELTVVASSSTILVELEIQTPAQAVPSGTVVLSAKRFPSTAVATLTWSIVEGSNFATLDGSTLSIKSTAVPGNQIKVKVSSGSISDEITITVVAETVKAFISVAETQKADYADTETTFKVSVLDENFIENDDVTIKAVVSTGDTFLATPVIDEEDGRTVTLTVTGHGKATVVITVDGSSASKTVTVDCLKAPDALDLPEYVENAGDIYNVGVNSITIDSTTNLGYHAYSRRYVNGNPLDHFSNSYEYTITPSTIIPLPIGVVGNEVCVTYEVTTPDNSGITHDEVSKTLTFTKAGTYPITVKSTSGSKRETTTSFTVNVVEGIAVNTFEELRVIGQYYENVNLNGTARPITLNPTEQIGGQYSLVPKYLTGANIYNKANGVNTYTEDDFIGLINSSLDFFGNTKILGNNVRIDLSKTPRLTGAEKFTGTDAVEYTLAGNFPSIITSAFFRILPSRGLADVVATYSTLPSAIELSRSAISKIDIPVLTGASTEVVTSHPFMEAFSTELRDFSIIGHWGSSEATTDSGAAGVDSMWGRIIEINTSVTELNATGTGAGIIDNKFMYIYPQCLATIDNINIRNLTTGLRVNRLQQGSAISNVTIENMDGGGIQVTSSITKLENLTFDGVGGTGLELAPESASIAGNEREYLSATFGSRAPTLNNQSVMIAGNFNLGNFNPLNTPALARFLSKINYFIKQSNPSAPDLTVQQMLNTTLMAYASLAGQNGDITAALTSLLMSQMAYLKADSTLAGTHLVALYLSDLSPIMNGTGSAPLANKTQIDYQLDETGGDSNKVVKLDSVLSNLAIAFSTPSLASIAQALNNSNKYISYTVGVQYLSNFVPLGEFISYNPLYGKTQDEIIQIITPLLSALPIA